MKEKRFTLRALLLTTVLTLLCSVLLVLGVLYALVGREGLGMAQALVLINSQFVGEHDIGKATDAAMDALVQNLGDRWSYYLDADYYKTAQDSKDNSYVGIGITISYPGEEGLLIEAVAQGGPGEQAGLKAGELILSVDGAPMKGDERTRAAAYTKGPAGTPVELTVRGADGGARTVTVTRARVEEHPVSYDLLPDGTGVVTIKNFNRRCADEAIAAVDDLTARGAKRLVFDVRNNGGGFLDELTRLLDHLLPEGTIFRSEDKAGHANSVQSDANCVDLPMAVLVNGDTYSAAEFFAAQLQEMDWGVIVGTPTFGKGYSQQTFPLLSGGAVNISTAKYFTGSGVSLIGTGLTLDREVELTDEQAAALKRGELPPEEDPQFQAALALIGG